MGPVGRWARGALTLVALAAIVAACATDEPVNSTEGSGAESTQRDGSGTTAPPDPEVVDPTMLISVETVGPDDRALAARQPVQAAVYADGTVFAAGLTTQQHPGPAVLPLYRGTVEESTVRELLDAAEAAGMTGGTHDLGGPEGAEALTVRVTVVVDGEQRTTSMRVLPAPGGFDPGDDDGAGTRAARQAALAFVDELTAATSDAATEPHQSERYRVVPLEPAPDATGDTGVSGDDVRPWTLDDASLDAGGCVVVTAGQHGELHAALGDSTVATRWRDGSGVEWLLAVRPLLSHEPDCPPSG